MSGQEILFIHFLFPFLIKISLPKSLLLNNPTENESVILMSSATTLAFFFAPAFRLRKENQRCIAETEIETMLSEPLRKKFYNVVGLDSFEILYGKSSPDRM